MLAPIYLVALNFSDSSSEMLVWIHLHSNCKLSWTYVDHQQLVPLWILFELLVPQLPNRVEEIIFFSVSFCWYFFCCPDYRCFRAGKKTVKLEICVEEKTKAAVRVKRCLGSSGLELKLDELRKELSSAHGGILPHSVLSTQQISLLCSQKPNSLDQASFIYVILVVVFVLIYI